MVSKSADELAKSAKGNIEEKHLAETGGIINTHLYDDAIIEYLNKNEQPEYIFKHDTKGFRITKETGDEKTPHHAGTNGRCYLLVTSHRILYIAGDTDGDESITFPYEKIADIDSSCGVKSYITIKTKYGVKYKFCAQWTGDETIEAAIGYINKKINSSIIKDSAKKMDDTEPVDVESVRDLTNSPPDNPPETSSAHELDYTTRGKEVRISGNTNQKTNCGRIEVYYDRIEIQQKGTLLSKGWITIPFKDINNMSLSSLGKLQIMTLNNDYRISGVGGRSGGKIQNLYQLYPVRAAIRQELSDTQITKEKELEALRVLAKEKGFSEDLIQNIENIIL
jgi:hypothetical protein